MQVELVSEAVFTVKANGKAVPGMRVVSEWEGLKKLQDSQGRVLIVSGDGGTFANVFRSILGDSPTKACVVLGHPDLVAMLSPGKPEESQGLSDPKPARGDNAQD